MENLKVKGRIWIETSTGLKIGFGRALLLEQIDILGSISEAAKELKMPYRRAWGIVRDINQNCDKEVVGKEVGVKSGGRSVLREEGKKIVKMFREINECFKQFSEDESGRFSGWEK